MTQETSQRTVAGSKGASITSLVLGLIAFTVTLFSYSVLMLVVAAIGLVFGIAGAVDFRGRLRPGKGTWIAGILLNAFVILAMAFSLTR